MYPPTLPHSISHNQIMMLKVLIVLFLAFLPPSSLVLTHPFVPTLQKLSDSTRLTYCWVCTRANNTHDEPELVAWPLSLE